MSIISWPCTKPGWRPANASTMRMKDPAGLNIATSFDVRRQGLQMALNSIGDSKNMLATAEGGLRKIQDILMKMKSKAMEAIGDTVGQDERTPVLGQL